MRYVILLSVIYLHIQTFNMNTNNTKETQISNMTDDNLAILSYDEYTEIEKRGLSLSQEI